MNDSRRIQRAISTLITELMVDILVVVVTLVAIFLYSLPVGWLVTCFLPIYAALIYRYHLAIKNAQQQLMIRYSSSESTFIDSLSGIEAIKGAGREDDFLKANMGKYGDFQEEAFRLGYIGNRLSLVSQLAGTVFLVAVLGTSCYLVANQQMDLGVLVAISEMLRMLVPALNKLTLSNLQIQEAKIALDRLYEFVQTVGEYRTGEDSIPEEINSIAAVNLNFRFPGKKLLLTGMNFELNTGKLTVLLGESGGGKSTLLQVLTGFYPLSQDDISVNGQDSFQKFSSASWRKSIGYVPQEIKIFNGSLIYNLMLSESTESIETVIMLCKEIGMHTFFRSMPQGYFTLVGEEGINLSG